MKINKKLMLVLAFVLTFTFVATSCGTVKVNEEKDRALVVATVNGEDIKKAELLDIYNQQKAYYGITEDQENDAVMNEQISQMKLSILDMLIENKIIEQKAKAAGYEVTPEKVKEAEDELIANLTDYYKTLNEASESPEDKTEEDYKKEAIDYINSEAEAMGMAPEAIYEDMALQTVTGEYSESVLADVKAAEADVQTWYDENLASQKEDPSTAAMADVQIFEPAGIYVKHILVKLSDEELTEYQAKSTEEDGEKVAKEYADSILKERADDIYAQAIENPDEFEALIVTYGEDQGMEDEANKEGYFVQPTGQFQKAFEETALSMKTDDISQPIFIDGTFYVGYHILKAYEEVDEKTSSFEETKDDIQAILDNELKNTTWTEKVTKWTEESEIKKYEKRVD